MLGSYVNVSQPDRNFYLCKGDEEQLFMCVSESRQGSLWTMFPHPLLIRLQSVRTPTMRDRKLEFWGDLKNSGSNYYLHNRTAWALPCLRCSPPGSGGHLPTNTHTHTHRQMKRTWSAELTSEAAQTCQCNDRCTQAHLLVINCEVIVEVHDAFGFRLKLSVRLLCPPLFEVPMTIILAP